MNTQGKAHLVRTHDECSRIYFGICDGLRSAAEHGVIDPNMLPQALDAAWMAYDEAMERAEVDAEAMR